MKRSTLSLYIWGFAFVCWSICTGLWAYRASLDDATYLVMFNGFVLYPIIIIVHTFILVSVIKAYRRDRDET